MVWITGVEPKEGYKLLIEFNTGERKLVDVEALLRGPIFLPVRQDMDYFRLVKVDDELGTIMWPNGADIDPDVLYGSYVPAWMQPELMLAAQKKPMDMKYGVILQWSNDDEAFIAEVPELSGCVADGATYEEALSNVEVIIQEWIETARALGRPIPELRGRLVFT